MADLPSSAYCGDTIAFTLSFASGTTGKVTLRHVTSGHIVDLTPLISGSTWTVTAEPLATSEAPSGLYAASAITTLSGVRETVSIGNITLNEPIDRPARETHTRKMVKMLELHLEGRLNDDEGRGLESYTIGGVPITKLSFQDARSLLEKYRRDLETENLANRAALGLGTGRRILTSFE